MNELQSVFFVYGIPICAGIAILIAITVIAFSNAEDFPHPDECFDCNNISCRGCDLVFLETRSAQKESIPIAVQPIDSPDLNRLKEKNSCAVSANIEHPVFK